MEQASAVSRDNVLSACFPFLFFSFFFFFRTMTTAAIVGFLSITTQPAMAAAFEHCSSARVPNHISLYCLFYPPVLKTHPRNPIPLSSYSARWMPLPIMLFIIGKEEEWGESECRGNVRWILDPPPPCRCQIHSASLPFRQGIVRGFFHRPRRSGFYLWRLAIRSTFGKCCCRPDI